MPGHPYKTQQCLNTDTLVGAAPVPDTRERIYWHNALETYASSGFFVNVEMRDMELGLEWNDI